MNELGKMVFQVAEALWPFLSLVSILFYSVSRYLFLTGFGFWDGVLRELVSLAVVRRVWRDKDRWGRLKFLMDRGAPGANLMFFYLWEI